MKRYSSPSYFDHAALISIYYVIYPQVLLHLSRYFLPLSNRSKAEIRLDLRQRKLRHRKKHDSPCAKLNIRLI
ncbi:hypothetical protein [Marinomonas sp. MED121]|uniref:hypothetical protein n=1 Tax=Marinomonas sp. MED121 TaxID=314277 RepID=UPI00103A2C4F|nr:hypothetical protein [Marinomonas sp. MED121]